MNDGFDSPAGNLILAWFLAVHLIFSTYVWHPLCVETVFNSGNGV